LKEYLLQRKYFGGIIVGFFDIDQPSRATDPRLGVKFSGDEVRSLAIAVGILTICFAVAFSSRGIFDLIPRLSDPEYIGFFVISLITSFFAVLTAFVLHEIGHKIVANHYGYPAAFSYSRNGLMFAAFISLLFGFLFAAPGAVLIYGYPTRKENGIISLAGPLTNLIVAVISGSLFVITVIILSLTGMGTTISSIFIWVAAINMFIGAFNLIPIGVLDGAKILKWNKVVYFLMVIFYLPGILFFLFFNLA
jgi:Zn-dependent protease